MRPYSKVGHVAPDVRSCYRVAGSRPMVVAGTAVGADRGGIRTVIEKSEVFPVLPTSMM
jgi:hypothetical protein